MVSRKANWGRAGERGGQNSAPTHPCTHVHGHSHSHRDTHVTQTHTATSHTQLHTQIHRCTSHVDGHTLTNGHTPHKVPTGTDQAHLTIQAQSQEHKEEKEGPEGRQRQHGHGLWVDDKGQARAWARRTKGQLTGAQARPSQAHSNTHGRFHPRGHTHLVRSRQTP